MLGYSKLVKKKEKFQSQIELDDITDFYNSEAVLEICDEMAYLAKIILATISEEEREQVYQQVLQVAQEMEKFNQKTFMGQGTSKMAMFFATLYMSGCWEFTTKDSIESAEEVDDETQTLAMAIKSIQKLRKQGREKFDVAYC